MNANRLIQAYRVYAAAAAAADQSFDLATFPDMPERPDFTPAAHAGELIVERGVAGARKVAEAGIENPDCSEQTKEAYRLILEAR